MAIINTQHPLIQQVSQPRIPLVLQTDTYTLYISKELQQDIKTACYYCKKEEWSGVFFYTIEGSFQNENLKIIGKRILIMDIGDTTKTSFLENPEIVSFMVDNPELLDCYRGLIHSHHDMSKQFIYSVA